VLLESANGSESLEVTVIGYEFPNDTSERGTANWLQADVSVKTQHGWGTSRAPFMHTWDASNLALWLESLSGFDSEVERIMVFPEPNLQLMVIDRTPQDIALHVDFILEQPGNWKMDDAVDNFRSYVGSMNLNLTKVAVLKAAISLRSELGQFPQR
jgi:hypothetical protein